MDFASLPFAGLHGMADFSVSFAKWAFGFGLHIGLAHFLLVGALLFAIGLFGLLSRRGLIPMLMCVELMLNAANINLVAFNRYIPQRDFSGQLLAVLAMTVAAAEIAIGLALAVSIYRRYNTVNVDELTQLADGRSEVA